MLFAVHAPHDEIMPPPRLSAKLAPQESNLQKVTFQLFPTFFNLQKVTFQLFPTFSNLQKVTFQLFPTFSNLQKVTFQFCSNGLHSTAPHDSRSSLQVSWTLQSRQCRVRRARRPGLGTCRPPPQRFIIHLGKATSIQRLKDSCSV